MEMKHNDEANWMIVEFAIFIACGIMLGFLVGCAIP